MTRHNASGQSSFSITVIGGGPVGLLTALLLAQRLPPEANIRLLAGRSTPPDDGRAAALIGRSMDILDAVGVGNAFRSDGAPMAALRMIDATGRLLRAPTAMFRSSEAGLDVFGFSLFTARIVALLREGVEEAPRIELLPVDAVSVERAGRGWRITDDEGRAFETGFVVASDGQRSTAREAAGIAVRRWSYPQTALTFAVRHDRDHEDISTEFHTPDGPFTLVPAGDRLSTVVWMTSQGEADRLMALDEAAFALAAERMSRSILGRLTLASARGAYPMGGLLARAFTAPGIALVGETGHAFPPIGAQGMNLGFRDADTLADALAAGMAASDPEARLEAWDRGRKRDAGLRTAGVDAFNRSLLTDFLPVAAVRGLGLAAMNALPPLRRAVMRAGLSG